MRYSFYFAGKKVSQLDVNVCACCLALKKERAAGYVRGANKNDSGQDQR